MQPTRRRSRVNRMRNNRRYDLSDRLIHFFRDLDLENANSPSTPQDWGHASITEDWLMPAFFLLRHVVRQGRIWATWSVRGGRRTIYGPRPAVCLTEMPIPAFIQTSRERAARGENIGTCALVFRKPAMFAAGARPAIYALSTDAWARGSDGEERSFAASVLARREQYRYVTYDPTQASLDWTHEREWRWPLDAQPYVEDEDGIPPPDADDLPGIEIDAASLRGIGVIVGTARQAEMVVHDILTKVDRGDIAEDHYVFIIARDEIDNWDELRGYAEMEEAIGDNLIDLEEYFKIDEADARAQLADLHARAAALEEGTAFANRPSEGGYCWLWLKNNRHPLVRALVKLDIVTVNRDGRYLVELPQIDAERPLQQCQAMITALCDGLEADLGIEGTYYTVIGSEDPDAIPYYMGDSVSDPFFYNFSYQGDDDEDDPDNEDDA
jgi:hypothetical protein